MFVYTKLFTQNFLRFKSHSLYKHHLPIARSALLKPKKCLTKMKTEKLKEKGYELIMNMKQPYRSLLIFLVGKSRCAQAVENLKEMAFCLAILLSRQCKVHTSQKIYQSLQLYTFYSRMWGEEMTSKMLTRIRRSLLVSGKGILMSAVCLLPYDWEKNKISEESLQRCAQEYENVEQLCNATVYCEECRKRQVLDKKVGDIDYCMCRGALNYTDRTRQFDSWEPFLERENILVWRRKHHVHSHLYSYKVYGTYDDMSLSAFMEVQLNPSFRTQWDSSALDLKVINSEADTNSDLMYWLVKFPHFFANRDYVFKRRFRVNETKKEVVIVNEIADESPVPEQKGVHRVTEYWSIMVLKAKESFHKPGMSYTLTYFDNPGTSLPTAVTNFVASSAFPDFLREVHKAAMSLQRRWENGENVYMSLPPRLRKDPWLGEGTFLPEIKPDSKSLVALNESAETQTTKLSQLNVIKEALMDVEESDEQNDKHSTRKYKIPLRFKKAVIDLLEAIEVTSPEYEQKTVLTAKIESLVDKLGLDRSRKNQLVKRLETLRRKTLSFMDDAARKKEESIKVMNEFEKRRYYYDQNSVDERTLLLVKALLININEVLKADKDMRTGKSFNKSDETKPPESKLPSSSEDNNYSEKDEHMHNGNSVDSFKQNSCKCEYRQVESPSETNPWYYILFPSWWKNSNNEEVKGGEGSNSCSCYQTTKGNGIVEKTSSSEQTNELPRQSIVSTVSLWVYNLFAPGTVCADSTEQESNKEQQIEVTNNKTEETAEHVTSWYYFNWIVRYWSKASV